MRHKFNSKKFSNHHEMHKSAINWEHQCSYKLLPHAYEGEHHVIKLPHTQLSYSYRKGGFMHDAFSPPNAISIAVIQECHDAACFDRFKLQQGMVLFFDDSQAFNFMSKGEIKIAIISIPMTYCHSLGIDLKKYMAHYIEDSEEALSTLFDKARSISLAEDETLTLERIEHSFMELLSSLMRERDIKEARLTKGESIALQIRDQVYHHMDGKINIETFAKEYEVSSQTLQNAFKSLFGFTPKQFLINLKLNLVYHDLQRSQFKSTTVQSIASKWGFSHMSRFSKAYAKLFKEKPSQTLHKEISLEKNMTKGCVTRQEEMI